MHIGKDCEQQQQQQQQHFIRQFEWFYLIQSESFILREGDREEKEEKEEKEEMEEEGWAGQIFPFQPSNRINNSNTLGSFINSSVEVSIVAATWSENSMRESLTVADKWEWEIPAGWFVLFRLSDIIFEMIATLDSLVFFFCCFFLLLFLFFLLFLFSSLLEGLFIIGEDDPITSDSISRIPKEGPNNLK